MEDELSALSKDQLDPTMDRVEIGQTVDNEASVDIMATEAFDEMREGDKVHFGIDYPLTSIPARFSVWLIDPRSKFEPCLILLPFRQFHQDIHTLHAAQHEFQRRPESTWQPLYESTLEYYQHNLPNSPEPFYYC